MRFFRSRKRTHPARKLADNFRRTLAATFSAISKDGLTHAGRRNLQHHVLLVDVVAVHFQRTRLDAEGAKPEAAVKRPRRHLRRGDGKKNRVELRERLGTLQNADQQSAPDALAAVRGRDEYAPDPALVPFFGNLLAVEARHAYQRIFIECA